MQKRAREKNKIHLINLKYKALHKRILRENYNTFAKVIAIISTFS